MAQSLHRARVHACDPGSGWLSQQVNTYEEVVDDLLDGTHGDVEEAERRFPERSHEDRPDRLPTEERRV